MARWKRTLARMLHDTNPIGYTYRDAASVLDHLDFLCAPNAGTSHRLWRRVLPDGTKVYVGLKESGRGQLKPYMVRDMVTALTAHSLVPAALLADDTETPAGGDLHDVDD